MTGPSTLGKNKLMRKRRFISTFTVLKGVGKGHKIKDSGSCLKKLHKDTSGSPTLELSAEPVKARNAGPQPEFLIQWVAGKNRGCSVKSEFQINNFSV